MQYEYRNKEIIVIFDYFDQRKLWDIIRECDTASGGVTPQTPADEISGRGEIWACIFGENRVYYTGTCRCVGIGRRSGLKIHRWQHRAGSSPATGTKNPECECVRDFYLSFEMGTHKWKMVCGHSFQNAKIPQAILYQRGKSVGFSLPHA